MSQWLVAALYHFFPLKDKEQLQTRLLAAGEELGICGTLLLADEGINGTIAGTEDNLKEFLAIVSKAWPSDERLSLKFSHCDRKPFRRFRVRLKKEIVTFRQQGADPTTQVGTYVEPKDWNELISRDDVVLIDTRNRYELKTGKFKGALDPETDSFVEFAEYMETHHADKKDVKVAMYCTGGIRCERATSYLLSQNFGEVFHLKGGILRYLEEVPKEESLWEGECFVFDRRVTVDHDLNPGSYEMCGWCGWPVAEEEKNDARYERGVSCPQCEEGQTEKQKQRARNRQQQIDSAGITQTHSAEL